MGYLAHTRKNEDGSIAATQSLDEHLKGTAELAKQFAEDFDSAEWAYALGMLHDVGKRTPEWQDYLLNDGKKVEHSIFGAKLAEEKFGNLGRFLSYSIAGHHAGLANWTGEQSSLNFRLQNAANKNFSSDVQKPQILRRFENKDLDISLWIRMLFSCLIDADRLDTERFCNPKQYKKRGGYLSINCLCDNFDKHMNKKINEVSKDKQNSTVFKCRQIVLEDCKNAAKQEGGFFSLTVPTGGGKTLSSMAFALNHAKEHLKKRIIYVIPYTSIIEQNADEFKKALGEEQIIEHHSSIDVDDQKERAKLATENWDAPIIVTTTVQFYESLFSAKTSKCRKLHNIANSVVILDEAQLMPVEFQKPILETLKLLTEHYKTSIVFCTATQPAFPKLEPREIIKDVDSLYNNLQRVSVQFQNKEECMELQRLSEELQKHEQVLCVVSDRKSARELHSLMPSGTYHLSAQMCAEHRSEKFKEIKEKLKRKETIRVISTQLIEAGVDMDFPVVYRQMAGLDSIAQAAGRCNREGKLTELGKVIIFNPTKKSPAGLLRKAAETTSNLPQNILDNPLVPDSFRFFFELFYWKANSLDKEDIMELLKPEFTDSYYIINIQFKEASEKFKIIDDENQKTIIVPYSNGKDYINLIKNSKVPESVLLRKLQRYTVNVHSNQFSILKNRGSLDEILPGVFALKCEIEYSEDIGLLINEMPDNPKDFM